MIKRRIFYLDPDIQFPLIALLILLITIESCFVGWGFYKAINVAAQWQRGNPIFDFLIIAMATIIPMIFVNFILGTFFSHKIAGPLAKLKNAMSEICQGNFDQEIIVRNSDLLKGYIYDFNEMVRKLRDLIYADYESAKKSAELLEECLQKLQNNHSLSQAEKEELEHLIKSAKRDLGFSHRHFGERVKTSGF